MRTILLTSMLGQFATLVPGQYREGGCEYPSCIPVIAPIPLPSEPEKRPLLPGAEWAIGKLIDDVRRQVSTKNFEVFSKPSDDDDGLVEAVTARCIILFHTKPSASHSPRVWGMTAFDLAMGTLDDKGLRLCAASLEHHTSQNH